MGSRGWAPLIVPALCCAGCTCHGRRPLSGHGDTDVALFYYGSEIQPCFLSAHHSRAGLLSGGNGRGHLAAAKRLGWPYRKAVGTGGFPLSPEVPPSALPMATPQAGWPRQWKLSPHDSGGWKSGSGTVGLASSVRALSLAGPRCVLRWLFSVTHRFLSLFIKKPVLLY